MTRQRLTGATACYNIFAFVCTPVNGTAKVAALSLAHDIQEYIDIILLLFAIGTNSTSRSHSVQPPYGRSMILSIERSSPKETE